MEWKLMDSGIWYFGVPRRGFIHKPLAIVSNDGPGTAYRWQLTESPGIGGDYCTLPEAILLAEEALAERGVLSKESPPLPRGGSSTGRPKEERV